MQRDGPLSPGERGKKTMPKGRGGVHILESSPSLLFFQFSGGNKVFGGNSVPLDGFSVSLPIMGFTNFTGRLFEKVWGHF